MKNALLITFCLAMWFPATALAAVSPGDLQDIRRQQEHIIRQQEERLRQQEEQFQQRQKPPGLSAPQPLPRIPERAGACMQVKKVILEGVTLLSESSIREAAARYEEKCLTVTDMNNLLRDISNLYIEKGYVTSRAFLSPDQALDTVKVWAGGNFGFDAGSLSLDSASVSSQGVMNGSFGSVRIGSGSFLGSHSGLLLASRHIANEGLVFSGGDAALRVSGTLSNVNGADIFAQGNLQLTGVDENSRMNRLLNDGANIESLPGLLLRADSFDNIGGSAEVSRVRYGQSYLHIGMSDSLQGYNADGSFNLVNKGNAKRYRTDKKALGKVRAYTAEQEALYGIPGGARDHLQEWKTVYREETGGIYKAQA